MNSYKNNIAYELYKLCSIKMSEKTTGSIDELYTHVFTHPSEENLISLQGFKDELKGMEEKGAVIFVDGFNSINLIAPKLSELFDSRIS